MERIVLVFGGCSSEHEVSINSASYVYDVIKDKYDVIKVYIDRDGVWNLYCGNDIRSISKDELVRIYINMDAKIPGLYDTSRNELINVDKALIIMHGKDGEDGRVQGLLEMLNIKVCGCSMRSSMLGFDKDLSKKLVMSEGIKSAAYECLRYGNKTLTKTLKYPLFVKPNKQGSSFGISKVNNAQELKIAIESAYQYDDEVIVEETVVGNEIGCGIIGDKDILVSEVDELIIPNEFFSYEEKYNDNKVITNLPVNFEKEVVEKIKDTASKIYRILKCKGFARIDMFITKDNEIYFNEVNTIPGLTSHSRFPMMFKASGIEFDELIERMIADENN